MSGFSDFVAISPSAPVTLERLDEERKPVQLENGMLDKRWAIVEGKSNPAQVTIPHSGLLKLPSKAIEALTLHFAGMPGTNVAIRWRNVENSIPISAEGKAGISLPSVKGLRQGWILLPPQTFASVSLEIPRLQDATRLKVHLYKDRQALPLVPTQSCDQQALTCIVELEGFEGVNDVTLAKWALLWAGLFLFVAATGALLLAVASILASVAIPMHSIKMDTAIGYSSLPMQELRVSMAIVGIVSLAWHAAFFVLVPFAFTPDSVTYFSAASAFANSLGLDSLTSVRTPGYPGFMSIFLRLFGNQLGPLIIAQHLILASLGLIACRFIYRFLGRNWAICGGILAGTTPWAGITANVVWTEALYISLSTSTVLWLAASVRAEGWRIVDLLIGGGLAGLTLLVRPAGSIILPVMMFVLLVLILQQGRPKPSLGAATIQITVFVCTFLAPAMPWMLELHTRFNSFPALSLYSFGADPRILRPASLNSIAWFFPPFYQGRVTESLDIQAPFQAYSAGWNYYSGFDYPAAIPEYVYGDSRYAFEATVQSIRADPVGHARSTALATYYNLALHQFPGRQTIMWADMMDVFGRLRLTRPEAVATVSPTFDREMHSALASRVKPLWQGSAEVAALSEQFLAASTQQTLPPASSSRLGSFIALAPGFALKTVWLLFTVVAGAALALAVRQQAFVGILLVWLFVYANILYFSFAAFGNDRYISALEPCLYILAVFSLSNLHSRLRRSGNPGRTT